MLLQFHIVAYRLCSWNWCIKQNVLKLYTTEEVAVAAIILLLSKWRRIINKMKQTSKGKSRLSKKSPKQTCDKIKKREIWKGGYDGQKPWRALMGIGGHGVKMAYMAWMGLGRVGRRDLGALWVWAWTYGVRLTRDVNLYAWVDIGLLWY